MLHLQSGFHVSVLQHLRVGWSALLNDLNWYGPPPPPFSILHTLAVSLGSPGSSSLPRRASVSAEVIREVSTTPHSPAEVMRGVWTTPRSPAEVIRGGVWTVQLLLSCFVHLNHISYDVIPFSFLLSLYSFLFYRS